MCHFKLHLEINRHLVTKATETFSLSCLMVGFFQKENGVPSPAAFHSAGAALKARQFQGRRKIALMHLLNYKQRTQLKPAHGTQDSQVDVTMSAFLSENRVKVSGNLSVHKPHFWWFSPHLCQIRISLHTINMQIKTHIF